MTRDPLPPGDPAKHAITVDLFRQLFEQMEQHQFAIAAAVAGRLCVPTPDGPLALPLTHGQQALFTLLGYAYALGRGDEAMPDDATSVIGIIASGVAAFANARIPNDDLLMQAVDVLAAVDVVPPLPPVV